MTVRQRLGVALSSELTVDDWKEVVRAARDQRKVSDLARLADQAFGKSQPEEEHGGEEDEVRRMSRADDPPSSRASRRRRGRRGWRRGTRAILASRCRRATFDAFRW